MSSSAIELESAPATLTPQECGWPSRLGRHEITSYRPVLGTRTAVALASDAVLYVTQLGKTQDPEVLRSRFARRVDAVNRVLGTAGHPSLLRPLGAGVTANFVWLAATSPGGDWSFLAAGEKQHNYDTIDSLAAGLAFLHDQKFCHGSVSRETVFVREDATAALAPWYHPRPQAETVRLSQTLAERVFSPVLDVLDVGRLIGDDDPEYRQIFEELRGAVENQRPPTASDLFVKLRATDRGRRFAERHGFDRYGRTRDLLEITHERLSHPDFFLAVRSETLLPDRQRDLVRAPEAWKRLRALSQKPGELRLFGGMLAGKTRWLTELAADLRSEGVIVGRGEASTPGCPMVQALRSLSQQRKIDDVEQRVEAAQRAGSGEELARVLESMAGTLPRRQRLVWLFDDVDRMDSRVKVAVQVLRKRATQGFTVITTETREAIGENANPEASEIQIPLLAPEVATDFTCWLLQDAPRSEVLGERLAAETAGHPFHLIELVRTLMERKVLEPGTARWVIPADIAKRPLEAPGDLMALVAHRIGDLDPLQRSLLTGLAIAGAEVDAALLAVALDHDEDAVFDALEALHRRAIVLLATNEDSPVIFRNNLARKFFASAADPQALALAHRQLFHAYQQRWSDISQPQPMQPWPDRPKDANAIRDHERNVRVLALHASGSRDREAQQRWLPVAASAAQRLSNFAEARGLYEKALATCASATNEPGLWLRLGHAEVVRLLEGEAKALPLYESALTDSRAIACRRSEIESLIGLALIYRELGRIRDANVVAVAARGLAIAEKDAFLEARAREATARCGAHIGNIEIALSEAVAAAELYLRQGEGERAARVTHFQEWLRATTVAVCGPREELGEVRRRLETTSDRLQLMWAIAGEAKVAFIAGRFRRAATLLDEAASLSKTLGDERGWALALATSAYARMARCDFDAANRRLQAARDYLKTSDNQYLRGTLAVRLAWLEFVRGQDLEASSRSANHAVLEAERAGHLEIQSWANATAGTVALVNNDIPLARHMLDRAIRDAEGTADRYVQQLFATHRASCEIVAGRRNQPSNQQYAASVLRTARDFAVEIGAPEVCFKATAGLAALGLDAFERCEAEGERMASAAEVSWTELRLRTDVAFFMGLQAGSPTCC